MASRLSFEYDRVGDILYVNKVLPYPEQDSTELDEFVVARMNPQTGDIENLEILFFSKRLAENRFELPVSAELRPL